MIKNTYRLQLATPAFLGDAEQKGVWRAPPLKALIREWWRIAVAPELGYDVVRLKQRETKLFGTAADEAGADNRKSDIRLALQHWNEGTIKQWEIGEARINHPEVKNRNTGRPQPVGAELYLGYGPLVFQQGTQLKKGAALQAGETNTLKLAFPGDHAQELAQALTLAHWFGTVGGRCRNGWGSLDWTAHDKATPALPTLSKATLEQGGYQRRLAQCLELDWPHAIGADSKGALVWRSVQAFGDWHAAMRFLAQTKIDFRTALGFSAGKHATRVEPRHVLAYPVTNHSVAGWGNNSRIANTLRFKLHPEPNGQLRALIYHTPCRPTLPHDGIDLLDTWKRVHSFLDANAQLARLD